MTGTDPWKWTRKAIEAGEEDDVLGRTLLGELADDPETGITELSPGVYYGGDVEGARAQLADHDELRSRLAAENEA